jgi:hypothetical protein
MKKRTKTYAVALLSVMHLTFCRKLLYDDVHISEKHPL